MSGTGALSVRYPFERDVRKENRLLVTQDQSEDLNAALAACAKGDRKALRHIYDSEAGRLVAVAQRILRRRDLAEEAVQEGFIRIWTKAHQFEPGRGSARGWIYAVIRNHALNMLRDGKREDLVTSDKLEELQDREQIDQIMASWQRLESGSRLHECLGALEETRRRTILMAYVGGYTHGEIAGRLRLPLGTAKSWIKRGLSALRECMR